MRRPPPIVSFDWSEWNYRIRGILHAPHARPQKVDRVAKTLRARRRLFSEQQRHSVAFSGEGRQSRRPQGGIQRGFVGVAAVHDKAAGLEPGDVRGRATV